MKTLIIILLTLTTIDVAAQSHLIGISGGVNWTNATSKNDFLGKTHNRQGVSGGITYEYFLEKRYSIGADVIYQQRGFSDDFEMPTGEIATTKRHYDYIAVPVKAGFTDFHLGNKFFGFAKAGFVPAILIDAKTKTPTFNLDNRISGTETVDVTGIVSKFDLAGLVEIGGGYKMLDRFWLTTSFIYQHSLTSISNPEYFGNGKIWHRGITLNAGLKWVLSTE